MRHDLITTRMKGCGDLSFLSFCKPAALACLALIISDSPAARGQTPPGSGDPYLQTVWTTEEGLPQNSVNAILQTRDGYLWLGTFGGLARFDGVKFTVFNSGNTPGLKSNRILSLCEDRNGALWLGADSGEVMRLTRDGVGQTYTTGDGLPGGHVWALREDRAGTLWAGTSNGLARFQDGSFTVYTARDGLRDDQICAIHEDSAGRLWLTTNGGLVEFHGGKFTVYKPPAGLTEGLWVSSSVRRAGGLWIGTRSGFAHFGDGTFISYPHTTSAPDWQMRTMMEDRGGTLWISYVSPSLTYRFKNGTFAAYRMKSGREAIRVMYEDREGNLWMGSDGGGLIRLKKRKLTTYTTDDGLPSDSVRAMTDDGAGGLWIATALGLAHARAGKFTTYTDKDGMLSYYVTALCRDRAGSLWIGSNLGLTQFQGGRFINYTAAQGLANSWVNMLAEDREGNLWVGTGGGLHRRRDGKFTVYRQADGLVHDVVCFIMQASDGALWLGTVGGLSRFKDGAFTNYTTKDGLSNDFVRAILEEPDGALWLGTYGGGLNRFKDGRFTAITTRDGLFDDFISRILEDERGNFWLLGNRGIFRVSRQELHDFVEGRARSIISVSYGIADGMKSSEGNGGAQPAGWKAADGKLWFPTIKGVAVLDPEPTNNLPPPVAIEQVTLDRVTLPAGQLARIRPGQENLEIRYTGLSFTRPEQVKFKYQMVGLDHDWVDAGTRRTAYYPHLPPGEYTFRVIADNGDGVWNMEGASLSVTVLPPFYQTWWFLTLAALGVAGAVWLAFQYRVAQLHRAQAAQRAFSRQLIASQEMERKRIAAELHDSLGQRLVIIKNLALMFLNAPRDNGDARQQVEEISAEASQAIGEVKEISYNLRPYQLDRIGLTKAVEAIVKKAAAASDIAFSAEIDDVDNLFPKESEINFYRIVQESLNNIVKHAEATEAGVTIRRDGDRLRLTIRDNGKGFTPGAAKADSQRGGFGLIGISERAQLLGGKPVIHAAPGQGTTVSIEIVLHSQAV